MNRFKERVNPKLMIATAIALVAPFVLILSMSAASSLLATTHRSFSGPFSAWGVSALVMVLALACFASVLAFPLACVAFYYQLFVLFVAPKQTVDLTAKAQGVLKSRGSDTSE